MGKTFSIQTNKANSALHAIKLIRKYFNQKEILNLLTSNFYAILFYNSEVWHIPTLKPDLKQILLSTYANTLKISQKHLTVMNHLLTLIIHAKEQTLNISLFTNTQ